MNDSTTAEVTTLPAPAGVTAQAAATEAVARPRTWPLYVGAFGSLFLTGLFQLVVFNRLSDLFDEYLLTDVKFGILVAVVTLLSSGLGVTAVWLVPRIGQARVVVTGIAFFVMGLLGLVFSPWSWLALLAGLLIAWGMAYMHLANGLLVQLRPHHGAQMTNLLHGTSALGKASGPSFAHLSLDWRTPFLGVAALAAAVGLCAWFGRAPAANGEGVEKPEEEEAPAREALRQRFFWVCAAMFVLIVGMEQLVTVWVAKYLQRDAGLSRETGYHLAWLVPTVILWTQCAGRFLAPVALKWFSSPILLVFCTLGSFGILLGTEFGQWTGPLGIAGLIGAGLAFALPYPTFFAIMCGYFPRHRGLVSVVSGAATSLAFIVFSAAGGLLGGLVGHAWPLRLSPLVGLALISGVLTVRWAARRRERLAAAR